MNSLEISASESARSRIAWRLLPFLFLLYVANYLDRTNIAYATLGMKGDLGLTDSIFGNASGIFFIGYLIGIAFFGLFQAIFMANAGGAWDNAKKMVEDEPRDLEKNTGKGSEKHKAAHLVMATGVN